MSTPQKCMRCANLSVYTLRNEPHCRDCFDYYIRSKCIKRMESYKIGRHSDEIPTFLLPLSFGISSTTLLYLIDAQLSAQRAKTRLRYRIKILHVDETILDPATPGAAHLDVVQARFPDAGEFLRAKLEDVYDFPDAVAALPSQDGSKTESMQKLLLALPSPTSREDMAGILRTRLVVGVARREGCVGVLWGDTTTRLADKVMAEAAKGRGFSLPWQISDGESYGLTFLHPLRDLFKKELATFVTEVNLLPLCIAYSAQPKHSAAAATSGRNITVGELLTQYMESMELQYPSTVMNVVRMGDKLKAKDGEPCTICGLPVDGRGNLTLGAEEECVPSRLCYGCMRATHGAGDVWK